MGNDTTLGDDDVAEELLEPGRTTSQTVHGGIK